MQTYYASIVKEVLRAAAPRGPGWDERFRAGLMRYALRLGNDHTTGIGYPENKPKLAPRPIDDEAAWPPETYILWETRRQVR